VLAGVAREEAGGLGSRMALVEQHTAIGKHVVDDELPRALNNRAQPTGKRDAVERPCRSVACGGEPDLGSVRRPREAARTAAEHLRQDFLSTRPVDDRHQSTLSRGVRVVEEGDTVAPRREAR